MQVFWFFFLLNSLDQKNFVSGSIRGNLYPPATQSRIPKSTWICTNHHPSGACQKSQPLTPALLKQSLKFNQISRRFVCTLKSEKQGYRTHFENQGQGQ